MDEKQRAQLAEVLPEGLMQALLGKNEKEPPRDGAKVKVPFTITVRGEYRFKAADNALEQLRNDPEQAKVAIAKMLTDAFDHTEDNGDHIGVNEVLQGSLIMDVDYDMGKVDLDPEGDNEEARVQYLKDKAEYDAAQEDSNGSTSIQ